DGLEAHRAAFDKTALAQIMKGDMGQFISEVSKQVKEKIQGALSIGQILGGIPPDLVEKIQTDGAEASKLLEIIGKHGVILGIEVRALDPPAVQATLIFPQAGKPSGPFLALIRTAAYLAKQEVKEQKVSGRSVLVLQAGPVQIVAWIEGADAVLAISTDKAEAVVERVAAKGANLSS